MSKSPTTIDPDWIENDHAGELLASEFMEPLALSSAELAARIDVPADRIDRVIDGRSDLDAELDLRLCRYFGLSEGFFLRLQLQYELLEAKRVLNGQLDRIVPRAA
jgi:addiction module HigA family antidote